MTPTPQIAIRFKTESVSPIASVGKGKFAGFRDVDGFVPLKRYLLL